MSLRRIIKKCNGGGVTPSSEQLSSNFGGEQPLNSSPLVESGFADGRRETSSDSLVFPQEDETKHVIVSESETIQPIVNQKPLQENKYASTSKSKISVLPQGVDMRANSLAPCGRGQGEGLRAAFTLAEVLITLGIIGIVAALTLPSVIAKYQKEQTVVQLKKAYSTLDNAARLSTVYNGEMQTWDSNLFNTNIKEYVATYYLPYINGEKNTNWVDKNYVIHNLNGRTLMDFQSQARTTMVKTVNSQMFIFSQTQIGQGYLWIFADINGTKGPNRIGRDVFVFDGRNYATGDKYYIKFWGQAPWWGREELVGDNISEDLQNSGGYGCSKENKYGLYAGYYCGALIMLDGWQIKQDYPW